MDISKEQTLVTVYMPTHNRVELLQRAAESVLNQDYQNIELIIVDDNSTDSTPEYLAELVKKDSRVRFFRNEVNSGACVSRNKAIFAAKGEFVTGLDDDDYFLPSHIASFIKAWEDMGFSCGALYPDSYIKTSSKIKKNRKRKFEYNQKDLICANWIGNQIFTKTKYLRSINGFDTNFRAWQDLECWYRLLGFLNFKAYSTGEYTYVVDVSHPHERLSTNKVNVIFDAASFFGEKHNLSDVERRILNLQVGLYKKEKPRFRDLILKVYYLPKLYNIRHACVLCFVRLFRK